MKKWILALVCAAVSSTAWAQQSPQYYLPVPIPVTAVSMVQPTPEPIPAPKLAQSPPPAAAGVASCPAGGCEKCACQKTKKVCVPEPSVKVKVSIKYSSCDEGKCYSTCFWPFGKENCDTCNKGCENGFCARTQATDGPNCGHVWPKRSLVKRIVIEEIPITKCTPAEVPVCSRAAADSKGQWQYPVQPIPASPIVPELIPLPKK